MRDLFGLLVCTLVLVLAIAVIEEGDENFENLEYENEYGGEEEEEETVEEQDLELEEGPDDQTLDGDEDNYEINAENEEDNEDNVEEGSKGNVKNEANKADFKSYNRDENENSEVDENNEGTYDEENEENDRRDENTKTDTDNKESNTDDKNQNKDRNYNKKEDAKTEKVTNKSRYNFRDQLKYVQDWYNDFFNSYNGENEDFERRNQDEKGGLNGRAYSDEYNSVEEYYPEINSYKERDNVNKVDFDEVNQNPKEKRSETNYKRNNERGRDYNTNDRKSSRAEESERKFWYEGGRSSGDWNLGVRADDSKRNEENRHEGRKGVNELMNQIHLGEAKEKYNNLHRGLETYRKDSSKYESLKTRGNGWKRNENHKSNNRPFKEDSVERNSGGRQDDSETRSLKQGRGTDIDGWGSGTSRRNNDQKPHFTEDNVRDIDSWNSRKRNRNDDIGTRRADNVRNIDSWNSETRSKNDDTETWGEDNVRDIDSWNSERRSKNDDTETWAGDNVRDIDSWNSRKRNRNDAIETRRADNERDIDSWNSETRSKNDDTETWDEDNVRDIDSWNSGNSPKRDRYVESNDINDNKNHEDEPDEGRNRKGKHYTEDKSTNQLSPTIVVQCLSEYNCIFSDEMRWRDRPYQRTRFSEEGDLIKPEPVIVVQCLSENSCIFQ